MRVMQLFVVGLGFAAGCLMASTARAQVPVVTVQSENDAYPSWGDDDYTNGLRISLDFNRAVGWGWLSSQPDCKKERVKDIPCRRTTLMIGQNFYTPRDISIPLVQEDERPYSAWLYFGLAARLAERKRLRTFEIQLGTTGKAAQGQDVQTWWHARPLIEAGEPKGWVHEVKPAPGLIGVIGIWDDKRAFGRTTKGSVPYTFAEAIPYYRLTVGNVHTNAAVGTILRFGYNLQRRWVEKIGPTIVVAQTSAPAVDNGRQFEFNVFTSAEVRAVGWNALLQHDTYTPRMGRLSIHRGVADLEAGVAIGYKKVSGGFRWVWRSPEFDGGRWSRFAGIFFTIGTLST